MFQYKNGYNQIPQSDYQETMHSDKAVVGKDPSANYVPQT